MLVSNTSSILFASVSRNQEVLSLFFMMIVSAFGSRCRFSGVDVDKLKLPNFYFWLTQIIRKELYIPLLV